MGKRIKEDFLSVIDKITDYQDCYITANEFPTAFEPMFINTSYIKTNPSRLVRFVNENLCIELRVLLEDKDELKDADLRARETLDFIIERMIHLHLLSDENLYPLIDLFNYLKMVNYDFNLDEKKLKQKINDLFQRKVISCVADYEIFVSEDEAFIFDQVNKILERN